MLIVAHQATRLDDTLSDPNGEFTVFSPTDDAFALLGEDTIQTSLLDTETLSDILIYHVICDDVGLSLSGSSFLVNTVTVIITTTQTDNGIFHIIDRCVFFIRI